MFAPFAERLQSTLLAIQSFTVFIFLILSHRKEISFLTVLEAKGPRSSALRVRPGEISFLAWRHPACVVLSTWKESTLLSLPLPLRIWVLIRAHSND